jgi:hypothetical protein
MPGGFKYPVQLTDEDRAALAQEFDAFRRGVAASKRALEQETPLAVGSIGVLDRLLAFIGAKQ